MRRLVAGLGFVTALLVASPAFASFHLMKVVEVFGGSVAAPNAQYVVIQMYSGGQNLVNGHKITIFNAAGTLVTTATFTANVANGGAQAKILIGTPESAALFGVTNDLEVASLGIVAAGGKACFDAIPTDCVEWGSITGAGITPWNGTPAQGLVSGRALARKLGVNGTLEAADDTDNSLADFALVVPAPKTNADVTGSAPASTCGDNAVTSLEQCDGGNTTPGDGCSATCLVEVCGDMIVNVTGETCDDGNAVQGDGCDNNCKTTACGNGAISPTTGETCDDGNLTDNDGCDHNCKPTGCGNGVITGTEVCDDGNLTDGDNCDHDCTATGCGNGIVTTGESCDPPNGTTCSATCQTQCNVVGDCADTNLCTTNEACSAGHTCTLDQVDPDDNESCTTDSCDSATGVHNVALDDGTTCTIAGMPAVAAKCKTGVCAASTCGDGNLDSGEQCDDGDQDNANGCTNACKTPVCGDTIVQTGEECDDGNDVVNDGCTTNCLVEKCGDGVVQANEECDDMNTTTDDGCSAACKAERCGDSIVQITEDCDDGNTSNTDMCTSTCAKARCGDGFVGPGEDCDDDTAECVMCTLGGDDGGGCCDTGGAGAPTAALGLVGLALLLRRRRN